MHVYTNTKVLEVAGASETSPEGQGGKKFADCGFPLLFFCDVLRLFWGVWGEVGWYFHVQVLDNEAFVRKAFVYPCVRFGD